MDSSEIRQRFLDFFASKDHKILPSASLVPQDDPTLLWINAGMAPFKKYFDGSATPPKRRVATSQKCIRTNDIENVGKTARHQTFFEMLGNFSFGDYFKEEAIRWGYEFLKDELGLDESKFWISIYKDDDQAFKIWHEEIGIPKDRIVRMGKDENFWEIGTGPCGPCSEIHYDRGIEYGCDEGCELGCECDRYLEVWNLVFTQYNKTEDGEYLDLPQKNIDTGVGLERLASLLQDVESNFDTDLFQPLIKYIADNCDVEYGVEEQTDIAFKVIADHIRSVTFAIGDGALPSNEGRGYVVRRLLRRAVRYAKELNLEVPFLHKIVPLVVEVMGEHYTKLQDKEEQIKKIVKQEEEQFQKTLAQGMNILEDIIADLKEEGITEIPGKKVFTLYDTYGFPKELTAEIAAENGLTIDETGFEAAMEEQRQRARAAREDHDQGHSELELFKDLKDEVGEVDFVGYDQFELETKIEAIIQDETEVKEVNNGDKARIILDETPFYAESGGQIGDQGIIKTETGQARVLDTVEIAELTVHEVEVVEGQLTTEDSIKAEIDDRLRDATAKNHTATHLLHQALKDVLGDHVNQSGSSVTPERLRFDFSHFEAVTEEELREIENIINRHVQENLDVNVDLMSLDEAKEKGAVALFGEKYGSQVRLVTVGDYSSELCGGTHIDATGEIGLFKIISESGVAAGTRRIEAVTGQAALDYVQQREDLISEAASKLKGTPDELVDKIDKLQDEVKDLENEITSLKDKLAAAQSNDLMSDTEEINGVNVILDSVEDLDAEGLRKMGDNLANQLDSGIVIIGSKLENKVLFIAKVTADLVDQGYQAGNIISEVAQVAGGGGGGRPDMAQAGGSKPEKLSAALDKAREVIAEVE